MLVVPLMVWWEAGYDDTDGWLFGCFDWFFAGGLVVEVDLLYSISYYLIFEILVGRSRCLLG